MMFGFFNGVKNGAKFLCIMILFILGILSVFIPPIYIAQHFSKIGGIIAFVIITLIYFGIAGALDKRR